MYHFIFLATCSVFIVQLLIFITDPNMFSFPIAFKNKMPKVNKINVQQLMFQIFFLI